MCPTAVRLDICTTDRSPFVSPTFALVGDDLSLLLFDARLLVCLAFASRALRRGSSCELMRVDGDIYEVPDEDTFKRKVTNKPCKYRKAIVLFNAVWCPPCRMIKSEFLELAYMYKGQDIVFMEVDVDKLRGIVKDCNVHSLPTFLCYAHGEVVDEIVGADKSRLREAVSSLGCLVCDDASTSLASCKSLTPRMPSIKRAFKKLMHIS